MSHLTSHDLDDKTETRVAIRYHTTNVPGLARDRAVKVANDYALFAFKREFCSDRDFVHLPTDFDSPESKHVWILCDFNIRNLIDNVSQVPLRCFKANYNDDLA